MFPTCLVEYQDVQIGKDLVQVYERNGIECTDTEAGCCGAPWLHSGNLEQIVQAGGDVVTGDCNLANTAIAEQTGTTPTHPIQLIARAYGIPHD